MSLSQVMAIIIQFQPSAYRAFKHYYHRPVGVYLRWVFPQLVSYLKYEKDPDLQSIYLLGFERSWQIIRPERNPLWNFAYGAFKPVTITTANNRLIVCNAFRWI